jgi:hypothetical protein
MLPFPLPHPIQSMKGSQPPAGDGPGPAARIRRAKRSEALQRHDLATLARAYAAGEAVPLGGTDFWRWERDGIPAWLIPHLQDLELLP